MYFLKSRYYDPETGRFISPDGIEYADPETINGLNLYAYCANNPISNVDPNGNAWWHWLLGIFAVVLLAAVVVASAIVTGGASLAVMGAGFLIGTGVNIVGQGINNVINGKGFFDDINILSALIGGLAGAAMATGIGGVFGIFSIGALEGIAVSSFEQKSIQQILATGLLCGTLSIFGYGVEGVIGKSFTSLKTGFDILKGIGNSTIQNTFKITMSNISIFLVDYFFKRRGGEIFG